MNFLDIKSKVDLCNYIDVSERRLNILLYSKGNKYSKYLKKKKSGGYREICAPINSLKYAQKNISRRLNEVFENQDFSKVAHGFICNKSIVTNAKPHLNKKYVVNIDILDFFPSITFRRVLGLFKKNKYISLNEKLAIMLANLVTYENKLPQGAPSSPVVSNLICHNLDKNFKKLMRDYPDLTITRYADDITLSCNSENTLSKLYSLKDNCLSSFLTKIVEKNGFKINIKKTRLSKWFEHQEASGLVVNTELNVNKYFFHRVRCITNCIKKYGVIPVIKHYCDIKKIPFCKENAEKFVEYYKGLFSYLKMVRGFKPPYNNLAYKANEILGKNVFDYLISLEEIKKECVFKLIDAIDKNGGMGTCFRIKNFIVTCKHNLFSKNVDAEIITGYNIFLDPDNPLAKNIKPCFISEEHDLAFFDSSNIKSPKFLVLSKQNIESGENINCIGFPMSELDDNVSIAQGKVESTQRFKASSKAEYYEDDYFTTDASIRCGNSGGPIINDNNELVGMACIGIDNLERSNVNGSLHISAIKNELKKAIKNKKNKMEIDKIIVKKGKCSILYSTKE